MIEIVIVLVMIETGTEKEIEEIEMIKIVQEEIEIIVGVIEIIGM